MLKYVLLGFLSYTPMTGYEIENYINASTGNFWHAKLSQIYMTLKKLEEALLLTSRVEAQDGRPAKRVYELTAAGRADLFGWLSEPDIAPIEKKDALLLKVFFAQPAEKRAVLAQLQIQLHLHQKQLERYRQETPAEIRRVLSEYPELAANTVFWNATRRHGELYEDMYIRWLQETIDTLESQL